MTTHKPTDDLAGLKAENARLTQLLTDHGIAVVEPPEPIEFPKMVNGTLVNTAEEEAALLHPEKAEAAAKKAAHQADHHGRRE